VFSKGNCVSNIGDMCGRYSLYAPKVAFEAYYDLEIPGECWGEAKYNVTPGAQCPVIIYDFNNAKRLAASMQWGFVPHWSNSGKAQINARVETIHEKPSFRESFASKRCLVLANSFFEWFYDGSDPAPQRVMLGQASVVTMAGIWDQHITKDGKIQRTFAIVTTKACSKVSHIHPRMPLILTKNMQSHWLADKNLSVDALHLYAKELDDNLDRYIEYHPVTRKVGKNSFNESAALAPCYHEKKPQKIQTSLF
jgi:putative SOS response-associated peptidase YedK